MNLSALERFAREARQYLMAQVSAKIDQVLQADSFARRESPYLVRALESELAQAEKRESVVDRVAYTWFNRFCALRFMDVNGMTHAGIVSSSHGGNQPDILTNAKAGALPPHWQGRKALESRGERVLGLLQGAIPSANAEAEAYRLLFITECNHWHPMLPFMFEQLDDYMIYLMPEDLLSGESILARVREAMSAEDCRSVEIIGWLYQFYISEKKDDVFAKKAKVQVDEIPAVTQLFTPDWIVRYMVQNTLGRLWMLNNPGSCLVEQMPYYISPAEAESDFLRISSPEEIKLCDPACGSGHILTYAFDLLYAIYEEEGYAPSEIPTLILKHNLYGIEIDERAYMLAAFALTMKARMKQRSFFTKPVVPHVCYLCDVSFSDEELDTYTQRLGDQLISGTVRQTLKCFAEAQNFGSLIRTPLLAIDNVLSALKEAHIDDSDLILAPLHKKALKALEMADFLSPKYHAVVANPPYMGSSKMNERLNKWAKENYPNSKSDLCTMFMERGIDWVLNKGMMAMVTMQSWMFLSSFEAMREKLLAEAPIHSLCHMANMVMRIAFGTSATVFVRGGRKNQAGSYCYVDYADLNEESIPVAFPPHNERNEKAGPALVYRTSSEKFAYIPGSPIAYWVSEKMLRIFRNHEPLGKVAEARQGMATSDNNRFLRQWYEVSFSRIGFGMANRDEAHASGLKWFPYNKGGEFRKWYGNQDYVVNWEDDGREIIKYAEQLYKCASRTVKNQNYYFRESVSWGLITIQPNFRYYPKGFVFDVAGMSALGGDSVWKKSFISYINSSCFALMTKALNSTMNFQVGDFNNLPYAEKAWNEGSEKRAERLIELAKEDWDNYETSWDFSEHPLVKAGTKQGTLKASYETWRERGRAMTAEMQALEEENNRCFNEAYDIEEEVGSEVPLAEISLTCNPAYRYIGGSLDAAGLEKQLLADTMKELVSYALGCAFGRYALQKPGLILANHGQTLADYQEKLAGAEPGLMPDEDNVIPVLDDEWFSDDATAKVKEWLRHAYGAEHYAENLQYLEQGLNVKGKNNYTLRDYMTGEFYNDHVKTYRKRPIYWLFSSPKGSFQALVYLHRYSASTAGNVRRYLQEFRGKLEAQKEQLEHRQDKATGAERTRIGKQLESVKKKLIDVEDYDRNILTPLAMEMPTLDLDDGVRINYGKLGKALKKIAGLDSKD